MLLAIIGFVIIGLLAISWWIMCVSAIKALVYYMKDKGCPPPTDKELREYTGKALKSFFQRR